MENLVSELPAAKQGVLRKRFLEIVQSAARAGADIEPAQWVETHWNGATVESFDWMKDVPRVRVGGNMRRGDVDNVWLLGGLERPVPLKNVSLSFGPVYRQFVKRPVAESERTQRGGWRSFAAADLRGTRPLRQKREGTGHPQCW